MLGFEPVTLTVVPREKQVPMITAGLVLAPLATTAGLIPGWRQRGQASLSSTITSR